MPRHVRKSKLNAVFRSRAFTLTLLVVASAVSVAVGREVARRVVVHKEVERLTRDIARSEEKTRDLEKLIAVLQSPTFEERAARTHLNLQKSGEKVIIIPDLQTSEDTRDNGKEETVRAQPDYNSPVSNTQRWWKFLFNMMSS